LKDPACSKDKNYPYIPFNNVKAIVLVRNVIDTVKSLKRRRLNALEEDKRAKRYGNLDNQKLVDYWCWVYESILSNKRLMNQELFF